MSHNLDTLFEVAAELRAVGHSWAYIAKRVQRKPRTCQGWPRRHRDKWEATYRCVQLRRFEETSNEAHSHLNALMRGDDLRGKLKAIELWLKCGARAYGGNGLMVTPEEIPRRPFLNDGEIETKLYRDRLRLRRDRQREKQGLPPATDAEFSDEWASRPREPSGASAGHASEFGPTSTSGSAEGPVGTGPARHADYYPQIRTGLEKPR